MKAEFKVICNFCGNKITRSKNSGRVRCIDCKLKYMRNYRQTTRKIRREVIEQQEPRDSQILPNKLIQYVFFQQGKLRMTDTGLKALKQYVQNVQHTNIT